MRLRKSGDLQATTFRYDANGNRINEHLPGPQGPALQGVNYGYDFENRLLRAQDYKGALPRGVADFAASADLAATHSLYLPNIAALDWQRQCAGPGDRSPGTCRRRGWRSHHHGVRRHRPEAGQAV